VTDVPLVRMTGIVKEFPGVRALRGVDLEIRSGEVHAVLGENGAGKSTLVKLLTGVYEPTSGTIELRGEPVAIESVQAARRLGIGAIYQELALLGNLTVAENIFLGRDLRRGRYFADRKAGVERSHDILARVGATFPATTPVSRLSVGQQQMVEIGRALSEDVQLLVLDEPTASLAEHETEKLLAIVEDLRANGIAIVYISHRLAEIERLADRVTVLRDGERVASLERGEAPREELVRMMVGRRIENYYVKSEAPKGDHVLEASGVCGEHLPRPASFCVRAGEVLGFAGLVGSGRTELARLVFGADRMTGGEVLLDGQRVRIGTPRDAIAHGIALVPEDRKDQGLLLQQTVADNINACTVRRGARMGFVDRRRMREQAGRAIDDLSIRTSSPRQLVSSLSGGNQQKVSIAKWLLREPRVLILDEPTRGVDVGARVELYRLINELASRGTAIVLISSELPEVLAMSDRVMVMRAGAIVAELAGAAATQESVMAHAVGHDV
jgi:ribose transport system ATP-binding protein